MVSEALGEDVVRGIVGRNGVLFSPFAVTCEREEIGDNVEIATDVLGSQATLVLDEDGRQLSRDH